MKTFTAIALVLSLSGCATVSDFCEEHSQGCVTTGLVVGTAAVYAIAAGMSKGGAPVQRLAPNAPSTVPPPGCNSSLCSR